ncbi:MAG: hypothetical protein JSV49_03665 [Thermoplasmata archaeon]|nr:MAG: hypothetical protein JSV49_03665 [Thermoplasmata archaeon]
MKEDMEYCFECGASTRVPYQGHPSDQLIHYWTPFAAGIMILLASIMCLTGGINLLGIYYYYISGELSSGKVAIIISGIVYLLGFYFGLRGTIVIFHRKNFKFAFRTAIFIAICGAIPIIFWVIFSSILVLFIIGIVRTLIILILAIIGIVLLWKSKDEFDRHTRDVDKQEGEMPSPAKPPGDAKSKPSPAQRLKELKELRKEGLITEKEFEEKRKKLVDAL